MLIIPEIIRFARKPKAVAVASTTLTLVGATWEPGVSVTLTFDRAIDVGGIVPSAIVVDDGSDTGDRFRGSGMPTPVGANGVRVLLVDEGSASGEMLTLTADANNGIVARGGTRWAGVTALALPFSG